jgi:hypothetical protein
MTVLHPKTGLPWVLAQDEAGIDFRPGPEAQGLIVDAAGTDPSKLAREVRERGLEVLEHVRDTWPTVADEASRLGVSKQRIMELVAEERYDALKIGGILRLRPKDSGPRPKPGRPPKPRPAS